MLHPMGRPLALASAVIGVLLVSGVARSQSAPAAATPPPASGTATAPATPGAANPAGSATSSASGELAPRPLVDLHADARQVWREPPRQGVERVLHERLERLRRVLPHSCRLRGVSPAASGGYTPVRTGCGAVW